nr:outer membrane lipoprotein [Candidatus Pantoea persica]
MNLIVRREDNKDAENLKKFVQAYQSDEAAEAANKIFNGGAVERLVIPFLTLLTRAALSRPFFYAASAATCYFAWSLFQ